MGNSKKKKKKSNNVKNETKETVNTQTAVEKKEPAKAQNIENKQSYIEREMQQCEK